MAATALSRSGGEGLEEKRGLSLLLRKSSEVEVEVEADERSEVVREKALTLLDLRIAVCFLAGISGFCLPLPLLLLVVFEEEEEEKEGVVRLVLEEDLKAETAID